MNEDAIIAALKDREAHIRLSVGGGKWMYFEQVDEEWVVLHRPYAAKKNRTLYTGSDAALAIRALLEES